MGDFNHITLAVKIWERVWVLNIKQSTYTRKHHVIYTFLAILLFRIKYKAHLPLSRGLLQQRITPDI